MQITLKREHGGYCSDSSWWLATVQEDGYEATGTGWYRKLATRRAVQKLRAAADIRDTLADAVNIAERAALARAKEAKYAEERAVYVAKISPKPARKPRAPRAVR